MPYKLAVFDMDGTILDTLGDIRDGVNHVLQQHGYPVRTTDEIRSFVGNGAGVLMQKSLPADTPDEVRSALLAEFGAYYREHGDILTHPYEGIPKLLRTLREKNVRLAVVSNKPDAAVSILCDRYFPDLFDCSLGEKEGLARKPAPDMTQYVLRTLGFSKEEAVYIGDSEVDVQTAENSGLDLLAVDWGFRTRDVLEAAGAETIISSPSGLLPYFS